MGIQFNWFKDVKIDERKLGMFEYNDPIEYIGGDNCNHSPGNVINLQTIFEEYGDVDIPCINKYLFSGTKEELISMLIPKEKVIDICNKFLNNPEEKDSNDMRDRIEWIKKLSEDGYYISYESL